MILTTNILSLLTLLFLKAMTPLDQVSVPTCFCYFPKNCWNAPPAASHTLAPAGMHTPSQAQGNSAFTEDGILVASDQYKFKLYTATGKSCRKTVLCPTFAGPVNWFLFLFFSFSFSFSLSFLSIFLQYDGSSHCWKK